MENRRLPEIIKVTVCICTFRRPSLLSTIDSVAKQSALANADIRILIIDNDSEPTARNIATEFRSRTNIRVDYKHVPGQNISAARNAGLDTSTTPWLAFVDDDEYASANWLAELVASQNGADAVFGPCNAIYDNGAPDWIKHGDYHSNRITESKGITTGYTSNVLIDMAFVRRHGLRFDPELGRTGGEDTMFFHAMYRKGGVLKYAPNAVVYERVDPSRVNLTWIVRRRYRVGQVRALVSHKFDRAEYRRLAWTSPFKVATCAIMSFFTILSRSRSMWWLMRGVFHAGTICYALGTSINEEYRAGPT
jgi:succinoglycan biosynthesis protein ExoM